MATTLQLVKPETLRAQVENNLRQAITSGQLKPGQKLIERELCEQLGVSRPSLREGMRTLAYMNILTIRHGGGSYVAALDPASLVEHLDMLLSIDDATIVELLQARLIVEPELAAIAAARIGPEALALINACLARMQASEGQLELLAALDVELHQLIAEAAGNPFMSRFIASLRYLSRKSRERTVQIDAIRVQSQRDHELIVAALNARDADQAREAMRRHLTNIAQGLLGAGLVSGLSGFSGYYG
jgi:GntR family transcriptional regulator, transcriptional repressor for pyruvate dehydrogenase complex